LRIVQEFIQNSLKHAGAKLITIRVEKQDNGLLLFASDNGKGFDYENIRSRGTGLTNMERRVHGVGGIFNLQSEPGKGTSLRVIVPAGNLLTK
jgi:signal transduction histidine kinase